jgi:hypothetical protein
MASGVSGSLLKNEQGQQVQGTVAGGPGSSKSGGVREGVAKDPEDDTDVSSRVGCADSVQLYCIQGRG